MRIRKEKADDANLQKLRRTFRASKGSFSVDAVIVELKDGKATMMRMDTKAIIDVDVSRLSDSDRDWIKNNEFWIQKYGVKARLRFEQQ